MTDAAVTEKGERPTSAPVQALAWLAQRESLVNPTTTPSDLVQVLRQLNGNHDDEARVLLSAGAEPIVLQGAPERLTRPTIAAQRGSAPGQEIKVSRSLFGALLAATLTAVLSGALALVLWRAWRSAGRSERCAARRVACARSAGAMR